MKWDTLMRKYSKGFTLLEVLVAVVVFSIGLLGLASLQVMGYRLNHDSLLRTMATIQANDMADRMRTNVAATALGATSPYNNPSKAATGNPNCLGKDSSGNNADVSCTAEEMAGQDFYEWYANLSGSAATAWAPATQAAMPSGTGVVCIDSTPNDGTPTAPACDNIVATPGKPIFAIKVWWVERMDANSPGTTRRYVMSFSL